MPLTALAEANDRTLAGRAADGDVRSFELLIHRHGPLLRSYSQYLLGSSDERDDVVQQAFVTAWQQLPNLADPGAVKPWLMRIVNRKCLDRIRARRPSVDLADHEAFITDEAAGPAAVTEQRALHSALRVVLAALPQSQRQSWLMKEVAGCSYDDIAEELHVPASTVRGLLTRARKALIREMEPWR